MAANPGLLPAIAILRIAEFARRSAAVSSASRDRRAKANNLSTASRDRCLHAISEYKPA
jgi:hypothetical protein